MRYTPYILLFLLLSNISLAFSLPSISTLVSYTSSKTLIIFIATVISLIISVLGIYVGRIFSDEQIEQGALNEIKATILNVVLFVLVLGSINAMNLLDVFLGVDNNSGTLDFYNNLTQMNAEIINSYASLIKSLTKLGAILKIASSYNGGSSLSFPIPIPIPGLARYVKTIQVSLAFSSRLRVYENFSGYISNILSVLFSAASMLSGAVVFIPFALSSSCAFLIPFGFFLRAFPFSRRIGSTFVSFGIAVLWVYPFFAYVGIKFVKALNNRFEFKGLKLGDVVNYINNAENAVWGKSHAFLHFFAATEKLAPVFTGNNYILDSFDAVCTTSAVGIGGPICDLVTVVIRVVQYLLLFIPAITNLLEMVLRPSSTFHMQEVSNAIVSAAIFAVTFYVFAIFVLTLVSLSVLGFTRALSIVLGGEFFLYGVQNYV